MTLQELFDVAANYPAPLMVYFAMLPITAWIVGFMSDREERHHSPWKYLYSTLVYMAAVPGILALVLCVYTFFFDRGRSLLQVNALVYFLPIIIMAATFFLVSNKVNINRIPGFDKLSGLMMMLAATFVTILIIQKTRIWVMFHGSVMHLAGLFLILFLLFMWGKSKFVTTPPERESSRNESSEIWVD